MEGIDAVGGAHEPESGDREDAVARQRARMESARERYRRARTAREADAAWDVFVAARQRLRELGEAAGFLPPAWTDGAVPIEVADGAALSELGRQIDEDARVADAMRRFDEEYGLVRPKVEALVRLEARKAKPEPVVASLQVSPKAAS